MANNSIRVVIQKPVNASDLGVQTVKGEGVNNTDPQNPILSFPNNSEAQLIRPIKTVNYESLEGNGNIEIIGGVTSVNTKTGDVFLTGEDIQTSIGSSFTVNSAIVTIQSEVVVIQSEIVSQQISIDLNTAKVSDINHVTIELPNVDNTSDADKVISNDTQIALDEVALSSSDNAVLISENTTSIENNTENIQTNSDNLFSHVVDQNNPHSVTAEQLNLGNVDNTSDADKVISNDTQSALDATNVEVSNNTTNITDNSNNIQTNNTNISNHVGDSNNPHSVTAIQVGLGNVNDTSDADKAISNDTQIALDLKVAIATNPSKTVKGAIKAFYDATTSTLEISIDGVDIP